MITVFYDGKCGLCSGEINHYGKIAPDDFFGWQDIAESADRLDEEDITLAKGLKLPHAKAGDGRIHAKEKVMKPF